MLGRRPGISCAAVGIPVGGRADRGHSSSAGRGGGGECALLAAVIAASLPRRWVVRARTWRCQVALTQEKGQGPVCDVTGGNTECCQQFRRPGGSFALPKSAER